jgi:hypothetical protein
MLLWPAGERTPAVQQDGRAEVALWSAQGPAAHSRSTLWAILLSHLAGGARIGVGITQPIVPGCLVCNGDVAHALIFVGSMALLSAFSVLVVIGEVRRVA